MQVYFLDPSTYSGYRISTISPLPTPGVFHHFAATFQQINSSQVQIQTYIDGLLTRTDTFSATLSGTFDGSPVTIGASNSTGEWFKGLIDEVSIYSRALSAGEIQAIYQAGTAGKCFDLNYSWFTPLP
jgi:Concanavalin A-like lectin/glucanases superfamily